MKVLLPSRRRGPDMRVNAPPCGLMLLHFACAIPAVNMRTGYCCCCHRVSYTVLSCAPLSVLGIWTDARDVVVVEEDGWTDTSPPTSQLIDGPRAWLMHKQYDPVSNKTNTRPHAYSSLFYVLLALFLYLLCLDYI
jgi:hypothetical protein